MADPKSKIFQVQSLLVSICHVMLFLVAFVLAAYAVALKFKDTALHMFLAGIGFHFCMAGALMSHYQPNALLKYLSHREKSIYHGFLNTVGGTMTLFGATVKFLDTEVHYTTWHGVIGLLATFMCGASMLGGLVNYFQPKLALKIYTPAELRLRHNLFGLLTFSLGMSAIYLAYDTDFFRKYFDKDFIPIMKWIAIAVYALTIIGPVLSLIRKLRYSTSILRSKNAQKTQKNRKSAIKL